MNQSITRLPIREREEGTFITEGVNITKTKASTYIHIRDGNVGYHIKLMAGTDEIVWVEKDVYNG